VPRNFQEGFLTNLSQPSVALIISSGASNAFALLGRYAAHFKSVVVFGHFETAYQFHLQGLSSPTPSRMIPIGFREMPAKNTRCLTPKKSKGRNYITGKAAIQLKIHISLFAGNCAVR